jgi:hypothetical protein
MYTTTQFQVHLSNYFFLLRVPNLYLGIEVLDLASGDRPRMNINSV